MFKNYLKVALRNFSKHKAHSSINIAGLAVGIACFVLIMLYVQFELSFDRYHENADRIYRVVVQQPGNFYLGSDHFAVTQAILGETLMEEFPEVLNEVTVDNGSNVLMRVGQRSFYEDGLLFADSTIFDIFTFPLKSGNARTALKEPFSVVLSEDLAEKYFGSQDPIGQTIGYRDEHDLKVTAVMKNVPKNSHYHFDMLISFQTLVATSSSPQQFVKWGNSSYYTYILVPQHFDPEAFEKKLSLIVKKYHTEPWRAKREPHRYYLQKLTDIHLYSRSLFDIGRNNDIRYIYLLSGLAFIILIIACINYMNLTTARAALRAREVGMRKVIGANRLQLLKQFIGESMLTTGAAALLAILITVFLLPIFSGLVEREFGFDFLKEGRVVISLVAVVLFVGAISGSYPALYLTAYRPVKVLKGELSESGRSRLRSALVIFQFAASVGLIFSTAAVQKQTHYIRTKKLGFNREQVLVMRMRDREARK
ncbi:ABC transporter permease, partial [bacterium]|nr:ABC transporter permease [bacterium]